MTESLVPVAWGGGDGGGGGGGRSGCAVAGTHASGASAPLSRLTNHRRRCEENGDQLAQPGLVQSMGLSFTRE